MTIPAFNARFRGTRAVLNVVVGLALSAMVLGTATSQTPGPENLAQAPNSEAVSSYEFILFSRENDSVTVQARQILQGFIAETGGKHRWHDVSLRNPSHQEIVKQYGVSRAPMPLILAIAPNGAITEGIMSPVTPEKIRQAIVSPATAACLKCAQENKIVCVCVTDSGEISNHPAFRGVVEFATDPARSRTTQIVTVDRSDTAESAFLAQLGVSDQSDLPVTIVLAPQGGILGRWEGPVSQQDLEDLITKASSGCCPGGKCGPGGCCPGGQCGPGQCGPGQCCPGGTCDSGSRPSKK